ncbi:MAG: GAF domain-containing protein, partial [Limisphaerales bacterium]
MIASTVALLLVSGGFVAYELATFRQTMKSDLLTLAQIIGDQSTAALAFQDKEAGDEIAQALRHKNHITAAALYEQPSGKLLSVYVRTNGAALETRATIPLHIPSNTNVVDVERFEPNRLIVYHTFKNVSESQGGTIFLESDLGELRQREERYAGIILLFMAASSVVTLFLSSLLQRVITRPIFDLAETVRAVTAKKNYSVRVAKYGRDELGQLVDGFNEMLGQIQDRDSRLQKAHDELEARVLERTRSLRDEISERRRAEAALQQQFVRISLLNQITQAISDRQDTDSILHVVLHQLDEHLGIDLGAVALFDAGQQTLNVAALCVKNSLMEKKFGLCKGGVVPLADTDFQLCASGQTVYVSDTLKWKSSFVERLAAIGWRSAVAVPLMVEEKLFGILIAARLPAEGFSSGDAEFLRMLSEHVALAAHQARLHTDLEKAYNE